MLHFVLGEKATISLGGATEYDKRYSFFIRKRNK
jgi:hypothetical protein